jgi:hypothetical protein
MRERSLNMDKTQADNLRWKSHSYELPNQAVIELAYCLKDLWDLTGDGRPSFEQANCRNAIRELIGRGMLPQVDDEYKRMHADVVSFCLGNQPEPTHKDSAINQETNETAVDEHLETVATGIFENIGRVKDEMAGFDWHGDGRDRRFFYLKCAMDEIWNQILEYRGMCWESELMQTSGNLVEEILKPQWQKGV